ncbi:MAG: PDZ domain-containing protein [Tannerella sp.]|jgi:carboxyl-terminal processing protease|nr:PDZ domain-containing protein [Tannerella sp.]
MSNSKSSFRIPAFVALSLIAGFSFGNYYAKKNLRFSGNNKIETIFNIINHQYVDTVDMNRLIEITAQNIINELDPHSVLIPADKVQLVTDKLEGSFSGIGVTFNMLSDTILIISVIHKGPAEKAGILPYDRIITINDSVYAGKNIDQDRIIQTLRGNKNSKVKLGIKRGNSPELLYFDVTRGDVPNYSIKAVNHIGDNTGYLKVEDFARTTYNEFITAIAKLKKEGREKFIIDLRGNSGGYMESAIHMINEFMPANRPIVYMEGKSFTHKEFRANGSGSCQNSPVVVLVDESSGSASEIFAGAIQDNDRGLVIGRRTYGKGLVQAPILLEDGSELRLTIARYYTPSGRCIQKNYEMGRSEEYHRDIVIRFNHGEFDSADSIKLDDLPEYKTLGGRTVYGGGGIMPDIFIPRDTSNITSYYSAVMQSGLFYQFVLEYSDSHHQKLSSFKTYGELHAFLKTQPLLNAFADFAEKQGIRKRPTLIQISGKLIENILHAYIVRNFFDEGAFYAIILSDDVTLNRAIQEINSDTWRPAI